MLTDALGLDRAYVVSMQGALPATRFAVEAYVNFVREHSLLEAVASSLTELFAPAIHRERIAGMLENYDFIGEQAMQYFSRRLDQADRDAGFALDYVKRARHHRRDAGGRRRRGALQVQRAVGAARRPASRLRHARPDPARRLPSGAAHERSRQIGARDDRCRPPSRRCRGTSSCATTRARDRWTILAPERVFSPDAIAVAVLQLCDGARTTDDIAEELARTYNAPKAQILADVMAMLQDLADKGVVQA